MARSNHVASVIGRLVGTICARPIARTTRLPDIDDAQHTARDPSQATAAASGTNAASNLRDVHAVSSRTNDPRPPAASAPAAAHNRPASAATAPGSYRRHNAALRRSTAGTAAISRLV